MAGLSMRWGSSLTLVIAVACMAPAVAFTTRSSGSGCDADNGGIHLPAGFCATIFADQLGRARQLAVAPDGAVYVALSNTREAAGGIVALRDTTGDGKADVTLRFGVGGGNGIALQGDWLYHGMDEVIVRYPIRSGTLGASGPPDTIVSGLPGTSGHRAKSIALDGRGNLFVNIGSQTNACQVNDRQPGSPGQDPCTELRTRSGIWRFDANRKGQTQATGERFATGMRNTVALTVGPGRILYGAIHGRDNLSDSWPALFTVEQNAELPAEEFVRIDRGDDFGWPYCYHDQLAGKKVLAPEYGGDGKKQGRCADKEKPLVAFPGHWAPNGVGFYTGSLFPEKYRGGAFIAFHGSWNRAPLPQAGFKVVFVPFRDGRPAGDYETFADGFRGEQTPPAARGGAHRPVGVAVAPDGALFISDDAGGRIWRVTYGPAAGR